MLFLQITIVSIYLGRTPDQRRSGKGGGNALGISTTFHLEAIPMTRWSSLLVIAAIILTALAQFAPPPLDTVLAALAQACIKIADLIK
jgi:hypothetical protein